MAVLLGGGNLKKNIVFAREVWGGHFHQHHCHVFRAPPSSGICNPNEQLFETLFHRTSRIILQPNDATNRKKLSWDDRDKLNTGWGPAWNHRRHGSVWVLSWGSCIFQEFHIKSHGESHESWQGDTVHIALTVQRLHIAENDPSVWCRYVDSLGAP